MKIQFLTFLLIAIFVGENSLLFSQNKTLNTDILTNPDNELVYKKEDSYKLITFNLENCDEVMNDALFLKNLKDQPWYKSHTLSKESSQIEIKSNLTSTKHEVVNLFGKAGYKLDNYTEKTMLIVSKAETDPILREKEEIRKQVLRSVTRDYPQFIDTGNPDLDNANYKKAKKEWIEKNPEAYQKLIVKMPVTEEEKIERQLKEENIIK